MSIMAISGHMRPSVVFAAALALALGACATTKIAPPPPMGDVSGMWLLETDGSPIRFVRAPADTVTLTVSREPLVLRQGAAVSDTSIAVGVSGVVVAGAAAVSKRRMGKGEAELVTAGPLAGQVRFFAPVLVFSGAWTDGQFSGTYRVDPKQVGEDVVVLDAPREWRLRRLRDGR